jgi:DNA repair exonuclease SbcCD ATPase subunit
MSSELDASEFVDDDFQAARKKPAAANPFAAPASEESRAPTPQEVDSKVTEMQQKLAELKQEQQELERERAALEELRRRQLEFTTSRQEMMQHLTRGVGLLEEAEFAARRDAEQMAKTLGEFRDALSKIQAIQEEAWTKEDLHVELTRALTVVENARMEWNAARLKLPVLNGPAATEATEPSPAETPAQVLLRQQNYAELCRLGLALTWPLAVVGLAALAIFVVLLFRLPLR